MVDPDRIRQDLFFLAREPLPCRTLNYRVLAHDKSTLHEADDFVRRALDASGYDVTEETIPVQAFVPDPSVEWGFRKPHPDEPWYEAWNIQALKTGEVLPNELVVLVAHKDSQSWLECAPGAHDNAVGVAALLEISRIAAGLQLRRSLMLLFCNEEHWPWTSIYAARSLARSSFDIVAVLNLDSIGGKSAEDTKRGRRPLVVRYSTGEGEHLADMISDLNRRHEIGLEVSKAWSVPNDDDGSFVNAGIRKAVLLIGSFPYADPNYHTVTDTPDKVDLGDVASSTELALATTLKLCGIIKPDRF